MLVHPRPHLLLRRVCDTFDKSVVGAAEPAVAQRQLKAGLHVLRSLARRIEQREAALQADVQDMEAVLATQTEVALPATPGSTLEERHQALQALIETVETRAWEGTPAAADLLRSLRELHLRMALRERS